MLIGQCNDMKCDLLDGMMEKMCHAMSQKVSLLLMIRKNETQESQDCRVSSFLDNN